MMICVLFYYNIVFMFVFDGGWWSSYIIYNNMESRCYVAVSFQFHVSHLIFCFMSLLYFAIYEYYAPLLLLTYYYIINTITIV